MRSARDGIVCKGSLPPATARPATIDERNSYDYRLVVSRKLYDNAVGTAMSPSLAHLPMGSALHLHPLDVERVGSTDGADVKVTSKRAFDGVHGRCRRLRRSWIGVGAVQPAWSEHRLN